MQHEVGIILRVKNLEEAKNQLKSVFSKETAKAAGDFNKKQDKVNTGLKETQKHSKAAGEGINDFVGRMFRSIAIIGLFNRTLRMSVGLFEESAGFERGSRAFEHAIGRVNDYLPELRRATRNTVEDMRLLQTATRAVTEGLEERQLTRAFEIATASARRMGRSVPESMDLVTRALVRNDEAALRGLGIQVDKNEQYQALQTILGRLPGPANRLARIRHTENFIMTQLNKTYGDFNQVQADNLEILERARASIQNFRRDLGGFIAITLGPLINVFRVATDAASGFLRVVQEHPQLAKLVGILGGVYTGVLAVKSSLIALKFVMKTLGVGKLLLAPLMMLGPKGLIIGGALIALQFLFDIVGKVSGAFNYARTAVRAFISLVRTYDPKTGLSQALKADKEALGGMWKWVVRLSRAFIFFKESATAAGRAVWVSLKPIRDIINSIIQGFKDFGKAIGNLASGPLGTMSRAVNTFMSPLDRPLTQDALDVGRKIGGGLGSMPGAAVRGVGGLVGRLAPTMGAGVSMEHIQSMRQQNEQDRSIASLSPDTTPVIEQEQDRKEMAKALNKLLDINKKHLDLDQTKARKEEQRMLINGGQ